MQALREGTRIIFSLRLSAADAFPESVIVGYYTEKRARQTIAVCLALTFFMEPCPGAGSAFSAVGGAVDHHVVPGHPLAQQEEVGHAPGGAGLLGQQLGVGEQLLVAGHVEVPLVLVGEGAGHLENAHQLHRHEKAVVGGVRLVLHALVELGHAAGVVLIVVHRKGKVVFQLDLARGVQLVEELQVLKLVGEHREFRHGAPPL